MDTHTEKFKVRLGLFIVGGLAFFVIAIFIIGKQQNLFNPVFKLTTTFYNVSGLQVGNNVRFTGINVGIVDNIRIINDSTVRVDMLIKKDVQQFIKSDCNVAIGSEGLIGDRLLIITQGGNDSPLAKVGQELPSSEPVETDAIMASLEVTAGNAEIITQQLAEVMVKVNSGKGTLGRLIQDSTIAKNLDQIIINLKEASKGLDETMVAVQEDVSAVMVSLKVTTGNAEVFSQQLEEIMLKVNDENGTFTKIIQDTTLAINLSQTMQNLNSSSKGLDENMEALKHNIFFRGYYNKKQKAEAEATAAADDKKNKEEQK
jgi:phospholipid/cholesterol/gamma-HCH transport system substrate-binding protein